MKLALSFDISKDTFHMACHIDIEWQTPCIHVIFGESGIGKTHLLRSISGLELPLGEIHWQHNHQTEYWLDTKKHLNLPTQQRHVAMVFQDSQLFSHLNVEQNLRFAFDRSSAMDGDWHTCINALNLKELLTLKVNQLSGGQAQRVALARAILSKPSLLILDEPLASLDWKSKQDVMGYLKRLNHQWQLPVLYVTHDVHEVLTLADHIIMLEKVNDITQVNPPRPLIEVLQDDTHPFYSLGKSSILITEPTDSNSADLLLCKIGEQTIRLPNNQNHTDTSNQKKQLRLCIAASDVSLALSPSQDTSIMNILEGKVTRIEQVNPQLYLIQVSIDGQPLLSEISAYSFERLGIEMWQTLYAQIKGVALQATI